MKKPQLIYKYGAILTLIVFTAFFSCTKDGLGFSENSIVYDTTDPDPDPDPGPDPVAIAVDEDTSTDLDCPASGEFQNNDTRNVDVPNPANAGEVDDRSCYSDYSESIIDGTTWGIYNITDGSNHWDTPGTLQPRIERASTIANSNVGSFVKFTADFRILEVGDAGAFGQDGTYIAQAKGQHTGGGGSPDPAICLYRAHPVYGTGINADKQVAFDIYAERILERGGSGDGREVVFLTQVDKNEIVSFELEVGFMEDPSDPALKIHYCNAVIGGQAFNWNIPDPERGTQSKMRYGAYRVRGGRAQIRWANAEIERVNQ
ncbi:hypothetical protein [uncultured Winogradskyella sp.]|uniref:hypothetical protein n=1 Tax=uncultured Winogradskyella sp. TaxID=395353 RepID=UPI0026302FCF|nr:hypothetical protein [uncultured Winogradskyella sp.]